MSDTPTQMPAPAPFERPQGDTVSAIIDRIAMPSLLFAGSLFALLLLSWTFLLPRFTHVERPDGSRLSPRQVSTLERAIKAELTTAEEHRMILVRPVNDELYRTLTSERSATLMPSDITEQLRLTAARIGITEDALHIASLSIDDERVTVTGDIRNVGLRSMTVLAAFSDAIARLDFIDDFERPAFTREAGADGAFRSPFTFSFTLVP
jgi:hypothetical protein